MTDLKLAYIAAEKDSITIDELRRLIRRVFASYFCEDWGYEKELICNLVNALYAARIVEAEALRDADDSGQLKEAEAVSGGAAEKIYCDEAIRLYMQQGADRLFAEEATMWPEVLPLEAFWDSHMLKELAALEVGHDLLVGDVLGALDKAERAKVS